MILCRVLLTCFEGKGKEVREIIVRGSYNVSSITDFNGCEKHQDKVTTKKGCYMLGVTDLWIGHHRAYGKEICDPLGDITQVKEVNTAWEDHVQTLVT